MSIPPAFVYNGPPRKCRYCWGYFTPTTVRQVYCDPDCRDKHKYDRRRKFRKRLGLCYNCGSEIEQGEVNETGRRAGEQPSYCTKCQQYFKDHYQKRKSGRGG